MDKQLKRIWKRRNSHSIRIEESHDGDQNLEHEIADESNVVCTNCGSLHTRASSALELNLDVIFKGRLYRCRKCKAHFRSRPAKTEYTRAGTIAAATAFALILISVGVANWERISGFFAGLAPSRSRLEHVQAPLKKRSAGDFTNENAEELAYDVVDLYQTADLYHRQFPAMERAYRDVIADYKDVLQREKVGQRAGNPYIADRLQRVSFGFAETLERGHDMLVKYMDTLRRQTDSANRVGAKHLQTCEQMKGKPVRSISQRSCDELALVLATLKSNTDEAELDYTGSEEVFQQTRQEINRIAVASIGRPILK